LDRGKGGKALDLEKELIAVHKSHAAAGFQIVTMLALRKFSLTRLVAAADLTLAAAEKMQGLIREVKR
jgi:hypothetical protein